MTEQEKKDELLRKIKWDIDRMVNIFVDEVQTQDVSIIQAQKDYELIKNLLKRTDVLDEDFIIDQGCKVEIAMKDFLKYSSEGMEF